MSGAATLDVKARTPGIEFPDEAKLRIYGDFLFLAFRSRRHYRMSVGNLRAAFEPAIETGQYRIFRFDGVPRGLFTWAWLSPEAEERYIRGGIMDPNDWRSGDRLWLIDIIAPYRGLTASIARWVMVPGNMTDKDFRYRRLKGDRDTKKIVHIRFTDMTDKARILSADQYLAGEGFETIRKR